jgi:nitroreductase
MTKRNSILSENKKLVAQALRHEVKINLYSYFMPKIDSISKIIIKINMSKSIETSKIKAAHPQFDVATFITDRFSPRAFSEKNISNEAINTLFEAASWAASANNEQPWEFYYAHKGTEGFQKIWESLMGGNQPWAKDAAALVVTVARTSFESNGSANGSALHDLGMANATLLLQARTLDIFGHPMGGFDRVKATEILNLDENRVPVCVIALGYLGDAEQLIEPFKTRELSPRSRKTVDQFVKKI